MNYVVWLLLTWLWLPLTWAVDCNCEVQVHSPMTGSHQSPPTILKEYQSETFDSYGVPNQLACRRLCQEAFQKDLPVERMRVLLLDHSQRLINDKVLGYNCTGLTTLKYPVRVKAQLGRMGLGNVVDHIQVVNHEELCFNL